MADVSNSVTTYLRAQTDEFLNKMTTAARTADTSMSSIEKSTGKAEAAMRMQGAAARDLGSQLLILVSAGTAAETEMTALAAVLTGGLAAAGSVAITVAIALAEKLLGSASAADTKKKAANSLAQAIHELNIELGKSVQTTEQERQATLKSAQAKLDLARATRVQLDAELNKRLALLKTRVPNDGQDGGLDPDITVKAGIEAQAADIRAQIAANNKALAEGQHAVNLAKIPILQQRVKESTDEAAAATTRYDRAVAALNDRYAQSGNADEYQKGLTLAQKVRDAELDALKTVHKARGDGDAAARAAARERLRELAEEAREAEQADRRRIRSLNDYLEDGNRAAGENARDYKRESASGLKDTRSDLEDERDKRLAVEEEVSHAQFEKMQSNIKSLASLYLTAFTGGAKGIGDALKQELQKAIAESLARMTINKLSSLSSSSSGLLSAIGKLASGVSGPAAVPARASGGYVGAGQLYQVNEGASPGNVEGFRPQGSGTIVPLGQMKAAAAGGGTVVHQHFTLDARGGLLLPDLIANVNASINAMGARAAAAGSTMGQAAVARRSTYRLG